MLCLNLSKERLRNCELVAGKTRDVECFELAHQYEQRKRKLKSLNQMRRLSVTRANCTSKMSVIRASARHMMPVLHIGSPLYIDFILCQVVKKYSISETISWGHRFPWGFLIIFYEQEDCL